MKSFFAILAAFSTITAAAPALAPWQGPAKFLISITATINDPTIGHKEPATYYLSKIGDGTGTTNKADAAVCSISIGTELVCSTNSGSIKISTTATHDMVPITSNGAIDNGFSVKGNRALQWESRQFLMASSINNKANFALYPSEGKVYLYADLGCPTGLHSIHSDMVDGSIKITPLE